MTLLQPWLEKLVGRWTVTMTTWAEDGTSTKSGAVRADAGVIAEGRYLREELAGDFGGVRHEKLSLLGWNATRARYEYVTADNHDGVLLLYATLPGQAGSENGVELFADYAAPDESGAGRGATFVTIRTVLALHGRDQRSLRNFYRAAGQVERPFLEYVYTREP